jgi:hypothetical protein
VKNHDFTPKNHIFSNCRWRRENFWSISCEKSRFYAKKSYFFPILGGARAGCAPPLNPPLDTSNNFRQIYSGKFKYLTTFLSKIIDFSFEVRTSVH